jgi:hypothetical protein
MSGEIFCLIINISWQSASHFIKKSCFEEFQLSNIHHTSGKLQPQLKILPTRWRSRCFANDATCGTFLVHKR